MKKIVLILTLLVVFSSRPALGAVWDYGIGVADTPATIDSSATGAAIDTAAREIKLPSTLGNLVSFWESGDLEYVVLTSSGARHYSFNGSSMVENQLLNASVSNPVSLAASNPFPDVIVADGTGIRHFSFGGSGMLENPALSVAGLTGVVTVGATGTNEVAALVGNAVQHYSFNGASMVRNSLLEPALSANPLSLALGSGGYDVAVLEANQVRWYCFTGSGMAENPALAVTGLNNPVALAVADPVSGYDLSVVEGNQVKSYSYTGGSMAYNSALSVTSGLTSPKAVAIRPGSFDRLIVDGNEVKYYSWTGSALVLNPSLSVTVSDIISGGNYAASAAAQSLAFDPGYNVSYVRVRSAHELPDQTSVTYSVTADGVNWVERWRVRGTPTGTVLEVFSGGSWLPIGSASDALPSADNAQLWANVQSGRAVKWKAVLATTNPAVTPRIATNPRGGVAVRWDTNSAPNPPGVSSSGGCYLTTTPTFTWTYSDPDGDSQGSCQVQVRTIGGILVYDSGRVYNSSHSFTLPTSAQPDVAGPLWSSGEYQFTVRVKVWDSNGFESAWSGDVGFCVVGFERPRVAEIVSPPAGQPAPDPLTPSTHVVIAPGTDASSLPRAKAGARVKVIVDSVGPLNSVAVEFPYGAYQSFKGDISQLNPAGSKVNRWTVDFWTDASVERCPSGTAVGMDWQGVSGAGNPRLKTPDYAAGVIQIQGTVLEDWFVILKGKD
ncbi:MAG: hypothetical protein NUV48_07060 [Peptococcaceae bacterium]|nr:hypothetical protein [Peptococcaceae bacterium]